MKQNLDKLLGMGFIIPMEEVTWLSPIYGGTKKEWEALNLHGFLKIECCQEERSLLEILDMVVGHEILISRWFFNLSSNNDCP
jgi:hypothetical protein